MIVSDFKFFCLRESFLWKKRWVSNVVRQSFNRLASDALIDRFLDMLTSSRNPVSQMYEIQCGPRTSIYVSLMSNSVNGSLGGGKSNNLVDLETGAL